MTSGKSCQLMNTSCANQSTSHLLQRLQGEQRSRHRAVKAIRGHIQEAVEVGHGSTAAHIDDKEKQQSGFGTAPLRKPR